MRLGDDEVKLTSGNLKQNIVIIKNQTVTFYNLELNSFPLNFKYHFIDERGEKFEEFTISLEN